MIVLKIARSLLGVLLIAAATAAGAHPEAVAWITDAFFPDAGADRH